MILVVIGLFVLRILIGFLLLELLWKTENWIKFCLKIFLSIPIGLGLSSLEYFLYLFLFAGMQYFAFIEIFIFLTLLIVCYKKNVFPAVFQWKKLSWIQISILTVATVIFITSFIGLFNYAFHRQEGDWDAWMIYNRTARFIYRGENHWLDAFSNRIDIMFHADYPPLLALNIASSWEVLNRESISVPLLEGLLFSIACVGIMAFSLFYIKSIAQAGLSVILLWGATSFVYQGGRQTADIPLACLMFSSVVFYYLYIYEKKSILLAFAGFCAGLSAWTKNEGSLFLLTSLAGISFLYIHERSFKSMIYFIIGLAMPLSIVLYFKLFLTPASEFLHANILTQITDISRHQIILNALSGTLKDFGPTQFFFPLILLSLLVQASKNFHWAKGFEYILIILLLQGSGYYFLYLVSPYDLIWHTEYSISRLVAHLYPLFIFLVLYLSKTPEELFPTNSW